ncbi:LLM class flavin-dependent oxidoreductase [Subtercola boreus]|nr:LLM class flavin-dependent oxidoreductase [Subtercola boreus]TQL54557.1 5,10-methylenetetrahydromethanopterin reductase [Subtercola boreus]
MKISCAFGPSRTTPGDIRLAEELGYDGAWIYDSPAVYLDPWMTLALAASLTERIDLGVGMLTPALRHPLVTASAMATAYELAPGRIVIGVGAGASSRWLLDEKPMRWAEIGDYLGTLKALLRGEVAEWNGHVLQMKHPDGWGPERPIHIPVLVGAEGPKGLAVAREHGDGVSTFVQTAPQEFDWIMRLVFGTELEPGEDLDSDRIHEAVGPIAGLGYHAAYAWSGRDAVLGLPNGEAWIEAVEAIPERERHLFVHAGHGVVVNDIDEGIVPREVAVAGTWVGSADEIRRHIEDLADVGVTEVTYQPGGPDLARELETFAALAKEFQSTT